MPLTHSFAALHLPSPSGSQFLPYRRQSALRSVAADEPHAAAIGSTLCANELRCQEERTVAPHCHLQKPMLNKLSGNAYGSPAHTLAPQSLAPLPALHRTSTSPNHKAEAKVRRRNRHFVSVRRHTLAILPNNALHIPLGSWASSGNPPQAVGGSVY